MPNKEIGHQSNTDMSYRPITDVWILARARLKPKSDGTTRSWYGAYLGGFPERARALLGVRLHEPVLHVCGGMAKHYPYARGFGPNDLTLDLDPETKPDFHQDVRDKWPAVAAGYLADPPYSPEDALHYRVGMENYPKPSEILARASEVMSRGQRIGIIHYLVPQPPKEFVFVACVGVFCGFNNRMRAYSVFEDARPKRFVIPVRLKGRQTKRKRKTK